LVPKADSREKAEAAVFETVVDPLELIIGIESG